MVPAIVMGFLTAFCALAGNWLGRHTKETGWPRRTGWFIIVAVIVITIGNGYWSWTQQQSLDRQLTNINNATSMLKQMGDGQANSINTVVTKLVNLQMQSEGTVASLGKEMASVTELHKLNEENALVISKTSTDVAETAKQWSALSETARAIQQSAETSIALEKKNLGDLSFTLNELRSFEETAIADTRTRDTRLLIMNTFDDVEQSMQQECEEDIEIAKFYLAHFSPIWGGLGLPREMISKAAGGLVEEYQRAIKELGTVGIHFGPPSGLLDFQKTVDDKKHKITHDDLLNLLEYAKISLMYVKEKNGQWKVFLYRHEIETFYKQHPEEVERDRQKTLELIKEDPALAETLGIKIPE